MFCHLLKHLIIYIYLFFHFTDPWCSQWSQRGRSVCLRKPGHRKGRNSGGVWRGACFLGRSGHTRRELCQGGQNLHLDGNWKWRSPNCVSTLFDLRSSKVISLTELSQQPSRPLNIINDNLKNETSIINLFITVKTNYPHMKGRGCSSSRLGCKFRILVSLRVIWAKRHYI